MADSKLNPKKKTFRPTNTPRYLVGEVDLSTLIKDLKVYNQHLFQVFTAVTKIDTRPPKFHALKYLKKNVITEDSQRLREIDRDNKQLVGKINMINRNKGCIDTWNPLAYAALSNWRLKELELRKIEKENKKIYQRLSGVKSQYPKEEHERFYQVMETKMEAKQRYPHYKITNKDYYLRQQPSIIIGLTSTKGPERTRVFMDFEIEECHQKLGRIIIELYNEYLPKACVNFKSICKGEKIEDKILTYVNCPVHKIVKDKYMECGDIVSGNGKGGQSIYTDEPLLPENFELKHTKAGVVSLIPLKGEINSQFCITFDEMPALDGKYIVIGKVVKGVENIFKINDCGKRYGRPSLKLIVAKCGRTTKKMEKV